MSPFPTHLWWDQNGHRQSPPCSCPQINIYCGTEGGTEDKRQKKKKISVSNDNFPCSPLFLQVLSIKSEWTAPDGSVLLPGELQQTELLLFGIQLTFTTVPLLLSNSEHGFAATSNPSSDIQQRKSFHRGFYNCSALLYSWISATLKGEQNRKPKQNSERVNNDSWAPGVKSSKPEEGTHLGSWWLKHFTLNFLEIVAAKVSEHLLFPPSTFPLGSDGKFIKSHKFMTHRWLWALKSQGQIWPNPWSLDMATCEISPFNLFLMNLYRAARILIFLQTIQQSHPETAKLIFWLGSKRNT